MATSAQRIERTDGSAAEAELAERTQAFAGRMLRTLNEGFLTLAVSLGHRTGLFDTMAVGEPATAPEIAEAAGLDERYVREWLKAVVLGGIVEHDPESGTYRLPAEHAAMLTRAAGPDNIAAIAQYVPVLAAVEDGIVDCFRRGGGLSYTAYPRFHAVMAEESGGILDATLLQRTLPAFPGVKARLEKGASLADVGCGRGHAVNLLARAYPQSRFVGYDFSEEAIAHARAEAEAWGLENARFEVRDVATLDVFGRYDVITAFDSIHDQAHPRRVLRNVFHALRPGGLFLMVDIKAATELHENHGHPLGVFLATISCMHCMTVSLSAGGEGLGTMWGERQARELLAEAGFTRVETREIEGDIVNLFYLASA
jgi:SAM-dependent methyltransferase